jgi:hypothetical protein
MKMFNPVRLINPGCVIIRVEALYKLICHLLGYPALFLDLPPRDAPPDSEMKLLLHGARDRLS